MQQICRRRPIRKCHFKKSCVAFLHGCSNVNLVEICRTPFQRNTSGGVVLCFISFVLVLVINNTFYWLAFVIYRPEFVDWSKTFLKVFFILCIFRSNFRNACCNWSTYYIYISIFSQANVRCNCRSSPSQVFFKKDHLICTAIYVKRKNFINNGEKSWGYFYFKLGFDQNLNSPKYGA